MERTRRMPDTNYFPLFQGEMRGYIAALREQEHVLASPTRFGSTRESALDALQRLGHTLAGLGATVDLPDVALLGGALNEAVKQILSDPMPTLRQLSVSLMYLTMHLETRLNRMDTAERFIMPDVGEMAEAERIAAILNAAPNEGNHDPAGGEGNVIAQDEGNHKGLP